MRLCLEAAALSGAVWTLGSSSEAGQGSASSAAAGVLLATASLYSDESAQNNRDAVRPGVFEALEEVYHFYQVVASTA